MIELIFKLDRYGFIKYVLTTIGVLLLSGCSSRVEFDKPMEQMADDEIIASFNHNTTEPEAVYY